MLVHVISLQSFSPYFLWIPPNVFVADSDILHNTSHPSGGRVTAGTMAPCGFGDDSMLYAPG